MSSRIASIGVVLLVLLVFGIGSPPRPSLGTRGTAIGVKKLQLTKLAEWPVGMAELEWSPDGDMLAITNFKGLWIYDITHLDNSPRLISGGEYLSDPTFSHDGHRIAVSHLNQVEIWNLSTSEHVELKGGSTFDAFHIVFSPKGDTLFADNTGIGVMWWDIGTGKKLGTLNDITSVIFDSTGDKLVLGMPNGDIQILKTETAEVLKVLRGSTTEITSLAVSPDGGTLYSASLDGSVVLWNTSTWEQKTTFRQDGSTYHIALSLDGSILASASSSPAIVLWNTVSGQQMNSFRTSSTDIVNTLALSPDNQLLMTDYLYRVYIWDAKSGQQLAVIDKGYSPQFNPGGTLLAFGVGNRDKPATVSVLEIRYT